MIVNNLLEVFKWPVYITVTPESQSLSRHSYQFSVTKFTGSFL